MCRSSCECSRVFVPRDPPVDEATTALLDQGDKSENHDALQPHWLFEFKPNPMSATLSQAISQAIRRTAVACAVSKLACRALLYLCDCGSVLQDVGVCGFPADKSHTVGKSPRRGMLGSGWLAWGLSVLDWKWDRQHALGNGLPANADVAPT